MNLSPAAREHVEELKALDRRERQRNLAAARDYAKRVKEMWASITPRQADQFKKTKKTKGESR